MHSLTPGGKEEHKNEFLLILLNKSTLTQSINRLILSPSNIPDLGSLEVRNVSLHHLHDSKLSTIKSPLVDLQHDTNPRRKMVAASRLAAAITIAVIAIVDYSTGKFLLLPPSPSPRLSSANNTKTLSFSARFPKPRTPWATATTAQPSGPTASSAVLPKVGPHPHPFFIPSSLTPSQPTTTPSPKSLPPPKTPGPSSALTRHIRPPTSTTRSGRGRAATPPLTGPLPHARLRSPTLADVGMHLPLLISRLFSGSEGCEFKKHVRW